MYLFGCSMPSVKPTFPYSSQLYQFTVNFVSDSTKANPFNFTTKRHQRIKSKITKPHSSSKATTLFSIQTKPNLSFSITQFALLLLVLLLLFNSRERKRLLSFGLVEIRSLLGLKIFGLLCLSMAFGLL